MLSDTQRNVGQVWIMLALRIVVALVFLYHGLPKAVQWNMASEKFVSMGFPGFLGPVIGTLEVAAALLVLAGVWYLWSNALLAAIILVALIGVQIPSSAAEGVLMNSSLERDLLLLVATLVVALHGPEPFTLSRTKNEPAIRSAQQ